MTETVSGSSIDCGHNRTDGVNGLVAAAGSEYDILRARVFSDGYSEDGVGVELNQSHLSYSGPNLDAASAAGRTGLHADPAGGAAGTLNTFLCVAGAGASWVLYEHKVSDGTVNRSKALTLPAGYAAMTCHDVTRIGSWIWITAEVSDKSYLLKLQQSNLAEQAPVEAPAFGAASEDVTGKTYIAPDGDPGGADIVRAHVDTALSRLVLTAFDGGDGSWFATVHDLESGVGSVAGIAADPASGAWDDTGAMFIAYETPAEPGRVYLTRWLGLGPSGTWQDFAGSLEGIRGMAWDAFSGTPYWDTGHTYLGTFTLLAKLTA